MLCVRFSSNKTKSTKNNYKMKDLKVTPDYPMSSYVLLGQKEKMDTAKEIMSKHFQSKNKEILERNNLTVKVLNHWINDDCELLLSICVLNEKGAVVTNLFRWN